MDLEEVQMTLYYHHTKGHLHQGYLHPQGFQELTLADGIVGHQEHQHHRGNWLVLFLCTY